MSQKHLFLWLECMLLGPAEFVSTTLAIALSASDSGGSGGGGSGYDGSGDAPPSYRVDPPTPAPLGLWARLAPFLESNDAGTVVPLFLGGDSLQLPVTSTPAVNISSLSPTVIPTNPIAAEEDPGGQEGPSSTANINIHDDMMLRRFLDIVPPQLQPCTLNVTLNRLDAFWKAWGLRGEPGVAVLEKIVEALFKRAIEADMLEIESLEHSEDNAHNSHQAGLFADLLLNLRIILVVPDFTAPEILPKFANSSGKNPVVAAVCKVTQDIFESSTHAVRKLFDLRRFEASTASPERAGTAEKLRMAALRSRAIARFIGHFYVRRLYADHVIAQVVHDLIGVRDRTPESELIHCVTDFLMVIGRHMDHHQPQRSTLMGQILGRLSNLAHFTRQTGKPAEPYYPQETRDRIQSLRDARGQKWPAEPSILLIVHRVSSMSDGDDALFAMVKELLENQRVPPRSCVDGAELKALLGGDAPLADTGEYLVFTLATTGEVVAVLSDNDAAQRNNGPEELKPDQRDAYNLINRGYYREILDRVTSKWLLVEKGLVALLWQEDNSITNVNGHFTEAEHAGRVLEASREARQEAARASGEEGRARRKLKNMRLPRG